MQVEPEEAGEELTALQLRFRRLGGGKGNAIFGEGGADRDVIVRDLEIGILSQQFEEGEVGWRRKSHGGKAAANQQS
jgi:hypothetical protein